MVIWATRQRGSHMRLCVAHVREGILPCRLARFSGEGGARRPKVADSLYIDDLRPGHR